MFGDVPHLLPLRVVCFKTHLHKVGDDHGEAHALKERLLDEGESVRIISIELL